MMKTAKKIIACALLAALAIVALCSCGGETYYAPIDSTEAEARTVATLTVGSDSYDLRAELYDFLFTTYSSVIDGGDKTVWNDADAETVEQMNDIIAERAADIYATLSLARTLGLDPYSEKMDTLVKQQIRTEVDNNYGGSYSSYIAKLAERGMNYSVSDLMIRYLNASAYIEDICRPSYSDERVSDHTYFLISQSYTREDVRSFYYSDECTRVLASYIPNYLTATEGGVTKTAEQIAESVRNTVIKNKYDIDTVRETFAKYDSKTTGYELQNGFVFGEHTSDYSNLCDAAMSLDVGEVSEIIPTYDGRYYILFGMEKSDEHFNKCYEDICSAFAANKLGELVDERKDALLDSIKDSTFYTKIHASTAA